ncbi:MAG: class I SAM-dependent RNA methyltransferase [Chloroflexi bacterium]|nr:class I SAM-dependent RNA methyltransferase [Chloroflexota bacterium]
MLPQSLEIRPEKLVYGGDALGRLPDGRAVFIPFTAPGESLSIRLVDEKHGRLRGEVLEVLEASPLRAQPRCPHFGACGGCHYQHLPYDFQLKAKADILRDQLQRLGKIGQPHIHPTIPSPQAWNYRNHIQFHLAPDGRLGFRTQDSQRIIPVKECRLPETALNAFWPDLDFGPACGIERVGLRLGAAGEVLVVLEGASLNTPELEVEAGVSIVHLADGDSIVLAGDSHLTIEVLERHFRVSAASFFQVNTGMAERMVEHLLSLLPLSPSATMLDVYCGAGLFSAFFAPRVGRLVGVESSASACEDFTANLDEFDNVELYEGAAEDILPLLEACPEIAIVDPPRAGLDRRVLEPILARRPATLAYVSCDPATLARDARRLLDGGYRLEQVTPFDLFPQTYHIESVSIFKS